MDAGKMEPVFAVPPKAVIINFARDGMDLK
jgi:hypothetical protein